MDTSCAFDTNEEPMTDMVAFEQVSEPLRCSCGRPTEVRFAATLTKGQPFVEILSIDESLFKFSRYVA